MAAPIGATSPSPITCAPPPDHHDGPSSLLGTFHYPGWEHDMETIQSSLRQCGLLSSSSSSLELFTAATQALGHLENMRTKEFFSNMTNRQGFCRRSDEDPHDGPRPVPRKEGTPSPLETFTYSGWERDRAEYQRLFATYNFAPVQLGTAKKVKEKLGTMKAKQQVFDLRQEFRQKESICITSDQYPSDNITIHRSTFTYPVWELSLLEFKHLFAKHGSTPTSARRGSSNSPNLAMRKLQGMMNKQRLFRGDRSHPEIVALDRHIFTYDGWEIDRKGALQVHFAEGLFDVFMVRLADMQRKQALMDGTEFIPIPKRPDPLKNEPTRLRGAYPSSRQVTLPPLTVTPGRRANSNVEMVETCNAQAATSDDDDDDETPFPDPYMPLRTRPRPHPSNCCGDRNDPSCLPRNMCLLMGGLGIYFLVQLFHLARETATP